MVSLPIHIPGTPTGADSLNWAIYQALMELGEILARHGFNTNDIGALYGRDNLPHLGILLRFPWSNDMRNLFAAYNEDLSALRRIGSEPPQESAESQRERATSMWNAI